MNNYEIDSNLESLNTHAFINSTVGGKAKFGKAGLWYLDLMKELDDEINKWKEASIHFSEKDPYGYRVQKYVTHANKKQAQRDAFIRFYRICESIINELEDQLWLKEEFETLMVLQVAALKQGKKVDVMKSVCSILRTNP